MTRRCVLLAALALAACGYSADPAPYRPAIEAAAAERVDGRHLYLRDCAWCHGARGGGTSSGPDLVSGRNGAAFTDFMLRTGRMPIDSPNEPSFQRAPAYPPEAIADIVDYVAGLGGTGPAVPDPDPEDGDITLGAELYQENCAACHSTTAIGGALTTGPAATAQSTVAPSLESSTPREVAEAMLVGPGTMPVFGSDTFSAAEVDSIVAYVAYLQDPSDRGGAPLARVGPVTEGAVAWLVGLGVMLVIARLIGTRTQT